MKSILLGVALLAPALAACANAPNIGISKPGELSKNGRVARIVEVVRCELNRQMSPKDIVENGRDRAKLQDYLVLGTLEMEENDTQGFDAKFGLTDALAGESKRGFGVGGNYKRSRQKKFTQYFAFSMAKVAKTPCNAEKLNRLGDDTILLSANLQLDEVVDAGLDALHNYDTDWDKSTPETRGTLFTDQQGVETAYSSFSAVITFETEFGGFADPTLNTSVWSVGGGEGLINVSEKDTSKLTIVFGQLDKKDRGADKPINPETVKSLDLKLQSERDSTAATDRFR